jgi:hypothetical protein
MLKPNEQITIKKHWFFEYEIMGSLGRMT